MQHQFSILAWFSALTLLAALAPTAAAQQPIRAEPAEVMVLGTYHFANPGLDVVQTEVADVLSPEKQTEIRQVVDALARFRPTRIAVEAPPASSPQLDSLYRAYRGGGHTLDRNEVQQLGFRLADRFDHARVYPIDHEGEFPFGAVMEYAGQHDPAFVERVQRTLAEITADENRLQRERTVGQILRLKNQPERITEDHGHYLEMARVGAGDTYVGAELLSRWYERNIHIFSNIQRLARPGDRVLVIIGSGHAAILRELVASDPGMELVDAREYLPLPPARSAYR